MSSQYAGHVTEVVKNCDLQKYSGLVTVSGDGLIFEVIYLTLIKICWNLDGMFNLRCDKVHEQYWKLHLASLFLPVEHRSYNHLSVCMPVCWVLHTFVPTFMHLEPPLVLYGCLSAEPWHERDFAPSTHPPKLWTCSTGLETGCKPVLFLQDYYFHFQIDKVM